MDRRVAVVDVTGSGGTMMAADVAESRRRMQHRRCRDRTRRGLFWERCEGRGRGIMRTACFGIALRAGARGVGGCRGDCSRYRVNMSSWCRAGKRTVPVVGWVVLMRPMAT